MQIIFHNMQYRNWKPKLLLLNVLCKTITYKYFVMMAKSEMNLDFFYRAFTIIFEIILLFINKTESKFSPRSRANAFYIVSIFSNLSKSIQIYPNLFKFIKLSLPLIFFAILRTCPICFHVFVNLIELKNTICAKLIYS